jgi:hypothetical protein
VRTPELTVVECQALAYQNQCRMLRHLTDHPGLYPSRQDLLNQLTYIWSLTGPQTLGITLEDR